MLESNDLNTHPSMNVVSLWRPSTDCAMCGIEGFHEHAVPWYCGPVATGQSEGGYKVVCKGCHDKWAKLDDLHRELDHVQHLLDARPTSGTFDLLVRRHELSKAIRLLGDIRKTLPALS